MSINEGLEIAARRCEIFAITGNDGDIETAKYLAQAIRQLKYSTPINDDIPPRKSLPSKNINIKEPVDNDLKPYGYAPGKYTILCRQCHHQVDDCDRRSLNCRNCARNLYFVHNHANSSVDKPMILKGIGIKDGDGFKDTTKIGEIIYVWNEEIPVPHKPGCYPRLGFTYFAASKDQYEFSPASIHEANHWLETQYRNTEI